MTVRRMQEKRGWAFWFACFVVKPFMWLTTKQTWVDPERIPETGGFIIAMNHLSHIDPITAAHLVYDYGRLPRYLAKAGLWDVRGVRAILNGAGQIPVERDSRGAEAYAAAVAAVRAGKCIVIYPEATITRDPDLWPMKGTSGAARIALETGCPVIPVGQWGAQDLLAPYGKRLHVLPPRKRLVQRVGHPVDLADLAVRERTPEVVAEATERIMAAITTEVEQIRGEKAPAHRWDMAVDGDRFKKAGR
ncbi:MAG TPA: lysophospholipid acyltransferase family protein [Nocardioides sp.]|nr:lysophospholipid acyltransferase family protein [Nocardioides sp.]